VDLLVGYCSKRKYKVVDNCVVGNHETRHLHLGRHPSYLSLLQSAWGSYGCKPDVEYLDKLTRPYETTPHARAEFADNTVVHTGRVYHALGCILY
jgi:hypothetical protein